MCRAMGAVRQHRARYVAEPGRCAEEELGRDREPRRQRTPVLDLPLRRHRDGQNADDTRHERERANGSSHGLNLQRTPQRVTSPRSSSWCRSDICSGGRARRMGHEAATTSRRPAAMGTTDSRVNLTGAYSTTVDSIASANIALDASNNVKSQRRGGVPKHSQLEPDRQFP